MKERPILFSGAMVRALLDCSKTQTRRIVKPQPPAEAKDVFTFHHPDPRTHFYGFDGEALMDWAQPCPYGEAGDRLYVRETWQHSNHPCGPYEDDCIVFYRADYLDDPLGPDLERSADGIRRQWRPSIHMPRAASRIALEVTGVRVERLHDITDADALAEGVDRTNTSIPGYARDRFIRLWTSINGNESWDANPWVWVIEFRKIDAREANQKQAG